MNLFASLELGRKALHASQLALGVAGENIANVNTPGFARRRLEIEEAPPMAFGRLMLGSGVLAERVTRMTDSLLHAQLRGEQNSVGRDGALSEGLAEIENILGETGGGGIAPALSAFYDSVSRLAAAPDDTSLRREVVARADSLASTLRQRAGDLASFRKQTDASASASVAQVNDLAGQIARLNRTIEQSEPGAAEAAELRDTRTAKLRELSSLVDVNVAEGPNGSVFVSLAATGDSLVVDDTARPLAIARDASGLARITVQRGGTQVDVTDRIRGGKLGGLLGLRDDASSRYLASLDQLASDLITRVNAQHRAGVDGNGAAGGDFFTPTASGTSSAATIRVQGALLADPRLLAAGAGAAPGDGDNARALAALEGASSATLGGRSSTAFLADLTSGLGLEASASTSAFATSRAALQTADERLSAISGVDLDEEAAALLQYQRSYEAAAKFLTVVNEMTQTALDIFQP